MRRYDLALASENGGLGVGRVMLSDGSIRLQKWSGPLGIGGSYRDSPDGQRTNFDVDVDVPPGAHLASGAPVPHGLQFRIQFETPLLEDTATASVDTPLGRIRVHLQRRG